jgi:hypothetical protein
MNTLKSTLFLILLCSLFVLSACEKKGDYTVILLDDHSVSVTTADGVVQIFTPDFMVLTNDKDPSKMLRRGDFGYVMPEGTDQGLLYNVPTWGKPDNFVLDPKVHIEDGFNPEFDRAYGKDRTANYFMVSPGVKISAIKAEDNGNEIIWHFEEQEKFSFSATLSKSNVAHGLPKLQMTLTPKTDGWFSVGYLGAPECPPDRTDEIWQGHIWQEKRFPNMPFLSESFRSSIPGTLMTVNGVTTSIIADPKYIPFEAVTPNSNNSQFGVMIRNDKGNAQSIVFAPVLGNADSKMASGKPFVFDVYLFQKKVPLVDAFEYIAYNVCGFSDIRRNSTCNLNTTIENTSEYVQSPYAMFIDSLKGFNYSTDVPGAVKNISGLHPLEIAVLTDDEPLFRRMARPMLEYGLSRERFLFSQNDKVKGQGTSSRLNGPGVPVSDLTTAYTYSGNRVDYFLDDAKKLYDNKVVRSLNLDFINYEDRWLNSLSLFRATSDQKYLNQAIVDCDAYLKDRVERTQTDYVDKYSLGWFFWTSFTNQWMELLQMYQLTGYERYLDAAHEGARYYTQYCWVTPVIPKGTIRVNIGGEVPRYRDDEQKYVYMKMAEQDVEAWKVSEIGLTPESSGTSSGHRGIFMAHHAPFMMRIAAETGDKFLHDMARNAVVGRYESFPGYHINAGRTNAFERKDFAMRSQAELNGHTSIHYNHPISHLTMLWDYLFSDFYFVSERQIDFPSEYSEGYAYCRSLIYGAHPGHFYDEKNVMPYMPADLISVSNIQANYLAGYGNGKLYVALSNQSVDDQDVTLSFDPEKSFVDPTKEYTVKLWKQNKPSGNATVKDGKITVSLKAKGITAMAIEGVEVQTKFQKKIFTPSEKWSKNYTSVGFEKDRAVFFDFGDDLLSVYVWNEANNSRFKKTTLHYAIDGQWKQKAKFSYPYEYTVEIPKTAKKFEYWFESVTPSGSVVKSKTGELYK